MFLRIVSMPLQVIYLVNVELLKKHSKNRLFKMALAIANSASGTVYKKDITFIGVLSDTLVRQKVGTHRKGSFCVLCTYLTRS